MFREILLHPADRDLHWFVMRESGQLKDMQMKRLTFGIKTSPYLASQVLQHLAKTHCESHPTASRIILSDFYVDDVLSGATTVDEADYIRKELCELLFTAGMKLRKWLTSSPDFRKSIPHDL